MKQHQLVIIVALLVTSAVSKQWRPDQQAKFQAWKAAFNKSYPSLEEEQRAMDSMLQNDDEIEAHNKNFRNGKVSFERGLWKRSDLSFDEKHKLLTGAKQLPVEPERTVRQVRRRKKMKVVPGSVNWVSSGLVHEVEDQKTCGSCYAFATAGVVEGVLLKKGITTRVSVQQIVDCNKSNEGCGGGEPILSLKYAKSVGLTSSSNYPYISKEQKCKSFSSVGGVSAVGRTNLNGNENKMKEFVATYGPVAGKQIIKFRVSCHRSKF